MPIPRIVFCLALVLAPGVVHAKMMVHYDLAGLAMNSQAIVIADRGAPDAQAGVTHYRVVRALRGTLPSGTDLALYDGLYDQRGHDLDTRVVLWLTRFDGEWFITSSGMRVVENGKVFRFEQWNNPGGWSLVPQGSDPQDMWRIGTPQLDMAGCERAIAAALRRVDAFEAARVERDPVKRRASVLAVMAPAGAARADGFYRDALAEAGRAALAESGDLEGALLVTARDHGSIGGGRDFGKLADLTAFAADASRPVPLRVLAINAIARRNDFLADAPAAAVVVALFADATPAVRAAAINAATRPAYAQSSDRREDRLMKQLAAQARAASSKLYEREQNAAVLYAIAEVLQDRDRRPLPTHRGLPVGARLSVARDAIVLDLLCLDPSQRIATVKLDDASGEIPAYRLNAWCGNKGLSGANGAPPASAPLAAGVHKLHAELTSGGKLIAVPLGSASADADGEITVTP
jgi:hypothetical protein